MSQLLTESSNIVSGCTLPDVKPEAIDSLRVYGLFQERVDETQRRQGFRISQGHIRDTRLPQ